mmetsp:Transcript_59976/g.147468  ORF Transcript_59976/g.147468 Transcript_59976/m.147468 type:complete len:307 (-) Transcript_59976:964-1884(-)
MPFCCWGAPTLFSGGGAFVICAIAGSTLMSRAPSGLPHTRLGATWGCTRAGAGMLGAPPPPNMPMPSMFLRAAEADTGPLASSSAAASSSLLPSASSSSARSKSCEGIMDFSNPPPNLASSTIEKPISCCGGAWCCFHADCSTLPWGTSSSTSSNPLLPVESLGGTMLHADCPVALTSQSSAPPHPEPCSLSSSTGRIAFTPAPPKQKTSSVSSLLSWSKGGRWCWGASEALGSGWCGRDRRNSSTCSLARSLSSSEACGIPDEKTPGASSPKVPISPTSQRSSRFDCRPWLCRPWFWCWLWLCWC